MKILEALKEEDVKEKVKVKTRNCTLVERI